MGVMDRFLDYMKLNGDDDFDDDYEDDYEEEEEVVKPKSSKNSSKPKKQDSYYEDERPVKKSASANKITPMPKKRSGNGGMEVCVFKPTSFDDSREISETLRGGRTVVLNLEGLDMDIAQRIIDFTSGACYALDGNLQKISHYIFIITPNSVDISGDFQELFSGAVQMSGK